ncbi:hypothetical protein DL93DRAFT_2163554 [Clavulina sp. PMI_390]|nr:hypothetical protein DL93DRAFT_2163554 [Clavulina sp. PMI_390]
MPGLFYETYLRRQNDAVAARSVGTTTDARASGSGQKATDSALPPRTSTSPQFALPDIDKLTKQWAEKMLGLNEVGLPLRHKHGEPAPDTENLDVGTFYKLANAYVKFLTGEGNGPSDSQLGQNALLTIEANPVAMRVRRSLLNSYEEYVNSLTGWRSVEPTLRNSPWWTVNLDSLAPQFLAACIKFTAGKFGPRVTATTARRWEQALIFLIAESGFVIVKSPTVTALERPDYIGSKLLENGLFYPIHRTVELLIVELELQEATPGPQTITGELDAEAYVGDDQEVEQDEPDEEAAIIPGAYYDPIYPVSALGVSSFPLQVESDVGLTRAGPAATAASAANVEPFPDE